MVARIVAGLVLVVFGAAKFADHAAEVESFRRGDQPDTRPALLATLLYVLWVGPGSHHALDRRLGP